MIFRCLGPLTLLSLMGACSTTSADGANSAGQALDDTPCQCALDQVCAADGTATRCVARVAPANGEFVGEIELLRQENPLTTAVTHRFGEASATFYASEPLPTDNRPKFDLGGGEQCAFESSSRYPQFYGDQIWPSGPRLGVGTLTFGIAGSDAPVELTAEDEGVLGWAYLHEDAPPPLSDRSKRYPELFDGALLPPSKSFQVSNAGGPHLGAQTLNGELPAAFTVTAPPIESPGATATVADGLHVEWSPPQPTAYMEIFVAESFDQGSYYLLSCKVADDGSAVIPAKALAPFVVLYTGPLTIQLRRTVERYTKVTTAAGAVAHLSVFGRHERVGLADVR